MSSPERVGSCKFFLSERDTQSLVAPLGSSGRIKYTCVAMSAHYLALGANTGGVYCFHRDHRYIQLLANKEGSVSLVRFSPDEQFLAVVAGGGTVVMWGLHLSGSGVSKRLHVSSLLKESVISDVVWEGKGGRVFFGDSLGRVAVASLPKLAMKSTLFRRQNEVIFQDKSPVVQLDLHGDLLMVSTHSRVVLLMLSSANKTALQVGKKSRDGAFGACFDVRQRDKQLVVYSARPGGRLWEADVQGEVQATVKMRGLVTSSPTPILGHGFDPTFPRSPLPPSPPPPLPLSYLHTLHNGLHLMSWDEAGLFLWQPTSWQLTAWTADLPGIVGATCEGGRSDSVACEGGLSDGVTVSVLVEGGRKVVVVTVATLGRCIEYLVQERLLDQTTKLVCAYVEEAVSLLPSHSPLLTSLSTLLQHTLTTSHNTPPPPELQTVRSQLEKIKRQLEQEEREKKGEEEGAREEREEEGEKKEEDEGAREEREEEGEEEREREEEGEEEGEKKEEEEGAREEREEEGEEEMEREEEGEKEREKKEEEEGEREREEEGEEEREKKGEEEGAREEREEEGEEEREEVKEREWEEERATEAEREAKQRNELNPSSEVAEKKQTYHVSLSPKLVRHREEEGEGGGRESDVSEEMPSVVGGRLVSGMDLAEDALLAEAGRTVTSAGGGGEGGEGEGRREGGVEVNRVNSPTEPVPQETNMSTSVLPAVAGDDQPPPGSSRTECATDVTEECDVGHVTSHGQSHDDDVILYSRPVVGGRIHRKSNSWSGVPHYIIAAETALTPDVSEVVFQTDDEEAWYSLSGSHTPSHLSTEALSRETSVSQDPFSVDTPSLESSSEHPTVALPTVRETSSALVTDPPKSPRQQTRSVSSSLENHSRNDLTAAPHQPIEREGEREGETVVEELRILRSQSLQLSAPPLKSHIAMATLLAQDGDDVIAVPVRSTGASVETGSKSRSKRRSRRSKRLSSSSSTSSLPASLPSTLPSTQEASTSQDAGGQSLIHIPEEDTLPFPDAGPPTPHPSLPHQIGEPDSTHILQRGSSFVSKMKELAKQGGHTMGLETDTLQEALNQPVRKVKELLSSLAGPTPTALCIPPAMPQTVFLNEDYVIPQPLPIDDMSPTAGVVQSDCSAVSHDVSPTGQPQEQGVQESPLKTITMETLLSLAQPGVYCSRDGLRAVLSSYLAAVESVVGGDSGPLTDEGVMSLLQSVDEMTLVDLLTLSLEVGMYGSQGGIVPFLSRYSILLHGVRTMTVLGMQEWGVRSEGWGVLVRKGGGEQWWEEQKRSPVEVLKELTNQKARAADLPMYLTSLLASDPTALVAVCVECWLAVQPWQVALLCTGQSDCSAKSLDSGRNDPLLDVYATYLTRLLGDSGDVREEVGCDEGMVLASLELYLKCGPPLTQLAGEGGRPRAWSHKCSWPHGSLLSILVDMCVAMTTEHLTEATSLCEKYGYWIGVAQLAAAGGDRGKSLLIIVSLRDASLLQKTQKWGNLLISLSDWQEALQILTNHMTNPAGLVTDPAGLVTDSAGSVTGLVTDPAGHVTDFTLGSHDDELTMPCLVYMLVDSVGPTLALHILASVGVTEGVASQEKGAELHSLMVQLAAIHAQQKTVARSLLEKVDRYLWSRQPVALSPQLQQLEETEREGRRREGVQVEDLMQSNMEWRPTLEDSSRHWGVRVGGEGRGGKRGECGVCQAPLSVVVSDQQPGVLLFHCGHAYHRHCIPELACYLCFKKNITLPQTTSPIL